MTWTDESIQALQEGAEDVLVHLFHMRCALKWIDFTLTYVITASSKPNSRTVKRWNPETCASFARCSLRDGWYTYIQLRRVFL